MESLNGVRGFRLRGKGRRRRPAARRLGQVSPGALENLPEKLGKNTLIGEPAEFGQNRTLAFSLSG